MSVVRFLAYENKLAKKIKMPGGKTIDEAVSDAQTNLGDVAEQCLADIDRLVALLGASMATGSPEKDETVYLNAREVAGLAALCNQPLLGDAAHSLCVLIDKADTSRAYRDAVKVHISTLQLMRGVASANETMQRQLVASLQDMVRRLSAEDASTGTATGG